MFQLKNILNGFLAGAVGGMAVDLIFITFIGPSALFTIIGITERFNVFIAHAVLCGILGVLFVIIVKRFSRFNIWLAGVLWGLICLALIGGVPSFIASSIIPVTTTATIFAFVVWILYGLILAAAIKFSGKKNNEK